MAKHTPTPWQVTEYDNGPIVRTADLQGRPIASLWLNGESPWANAAYIVKAVNNHERMVAELQRLFNLYGHQATADLLRDVGTVKVQGGDNV